MDADVFWENVNRLLDTDTLMYVPNFGAQAYILMYTDVLRWKFIYDIKEHYSRIRE
jgi:hypothetical protein